MEDVFLDDPNWDIEVNERRWAMACHFLALVGSCIPMANFVFPLLAWLYKKKYSSFVDKHGKSALNFQLTILIAAIVAFGITEAVDEFAGVMFGLGIFICQLSFTLINANRAFQGHVAHYPLQIKLFK